MEAFIQKVIKVNKLNCTLGNILQYNNHLYTQYKNIKSKSRKVRLFEKKIQKPILLRSSNNYCVTVKYFLRDEDIGLIIDYMNDSVYCANIIDNINFKWYDYFLCC